ncbi:MAG TPA: hypothetical protein PLT32_01750 [bacterium]|nr:hypothetical protein [bacterium]
MIFGSSKKERKSTSHDNFDGQEVINWSSTEGYDAVRQVNNRLRWPSVWGNSKDEKAKKTEEVKKVEKVKEIKEVKKIKKVEKPKFDLGLFLKTLFKSSKPEQNKIQLEKNKQEQIRQEKVRQEKIAQEKAEQEKKQQEKIKQEQLEKERLAREMAEKERLEKEKIAKEKVLQEKTAKERAEQEKKRQLKIKAEAEAKAKAEAEAEAIAKAKAEEAAKKAKLQVLKTNKERNQQIKEAGQESREQEEDRKSDIFKAKESHHQQKNKELTKDKKPSLLDRWKNYFAAKKIKQLNKIDRKKIKRFADSLKSVEESISQDEYLAKEDLRLKAAARKMNQVASFNLKPAVVKKNDNQKIEKIVEKKIEVDKIEKPSKQRVFTDLRKNFEQKSWNKPSLTETNLASGRTTLYFNWSKFWLALIQWLVVTLFFIAISGSMLYLWQQKQRRQSLEVSQRFGRIDQLISLTENEVGDVLDFRGRLIVVNDLLKNHIYWSDFFSFLEKNTLPNVFYQDFSGDTSGEYLLKARTDSFDSMAKQLKVFRRAPEVIEVSSEGGEMIKVEEKSKAEDGIKTDDQLIVNDEDGNKKDTKTKLTNQLTFSIKIKIKPEVFLR